MEEVAESEPITTNLNNEQGEYAFTVPELHCLEI